MNTSSGNELTLCELMMTLRFDRPALIDNYPSFVLRSILGKELKRMHCAMRGAPCSGCPFSSTCAYAFIFESPIEKTTWSLAGRDHSSHPFRLVSYAIPGTLVRELTFTLQLYGRGVDYLPHCIFAFREAGKIGLFRARVPATLVSVRCGDTQVLSGDKVLLGKVARETLAIDVHRNGLLADDVIVSCRTPVRFKYRGTYKTDFDGDAFLEACFRRVSTLLERYGAKPFDPGALTHHESSGTSSPCTVLHESTLRWVDFTHYSGRQETCMLLGGVVGSFRLTGETSAVKWNVLSACARVGTGKNTSFGYGTIEVRPYSDKESKTDGIS